MYCSCRELPIPTRGRSYRHRCPGLPKLRLKEDDVCLKAAFPVQQIYHQTGNELSLPPRRRPQAEHQPAKRQPQRLHEWQDYAQQERHSNSTDFEIQVEETRKDLQPIPLQLLHFSPIRYAPKRKATGASAAGGKTPDTSRTAGAAAGTGHIFNIYKNVREDHTLLSYDAYPAWLLTLGQPEKSYGELAFTFLYGVGIENATLQEYMRFSRLHTKNLIKLNNMRLKKAKRSSVKPIYYDV